MKRLLLIFCAALLLASSCERYDDILDRLSSLEQRVEEIENQCRRLNSNVDAIQTVLSAVQQNDYVTEVMKILEDGEVVGYSITFARGGTITIYHGEGVAAGTGPDIGVRKAADGQYYWTADDEWMTDENGDKIPAVVPDDPAGEYVTPQFRVSAGTWYVSYDNGNSWRELGEIGKGGDQFFKDVQYDGEYICFTLLDDTKVLIPRINKVKNHWEGKKWYAYGTSLTSASQGKYVPYVAELSGLDVVNKGIGGGGIISNTRVKDAVMNTTDGKLEADLITLEVGANDASAPLGEPWDNTADTFLGSLTQCINYLLQNTNARIVVMSSPIGRYTTSGGSTEITPDRYKYLERWQGIRDVCIKCGVHYIGLADESGMGWARLNNNMDIDYNTDNIHHTDIGGYNLAVYMWSKLKDIPLWYTSVPDGDDENGQTFNFDVTKGSVVIKYEGYKFETGKSYDVYFEWSELPSVPDGVKTVWKLSTTNDNTIITNSADHLLEPIYWARVDGAIDESKGQKANVQSASLTFTPTQNADYLYFYVQQATNQQLTCALSIKEKIFTCTEIAKVNSGGRNMQGFDIYNDIIFQCCDGGYCRTYDLNTGALIADFPLGSNVSTNHAGGVNFGLEFPDGSEYPALYVSGDLTTKDCYVEKVTPNRSELIQTIHFDLDNNSSFNGAQVVIDKDRKRLIYQQRESTSISDVDNKFHIYEFDIPALDDSEVILTSSDVLCEYVLTHYSPYYQGACIHNGQFLQTHGYAVDKTGVKVGLLFFNMDITDNRDLIARIKFDGLIDYEPQGVTVYNNRLIMSFVNSTYYEIQFKG